MRFKHGTSRFRLKRGGGGGVLNHDDTPGYTFIRV